MYKEFFGLRANPFNVNPDPRYLYLTRHTEEALACLTYGIQSRKGFVLLTGEVGTGKTTLINCACSKWQRPSSSTLEWTCPSCSTS
jgi:general secretion pathway protein A